MSAPRSRGATLGLLGLGGYGLSVAAVGVVAALGVLSPGASAAGGPSGAGGVLGRVVRPAPVVSPSAGTGVVPGSGLVPASIPAAQVGVSAPGQVQPFQPRELVLPGGAQAQVLAAGVRPDGSMVIPPDPQEVGWWTGGALPGEPFGTTVLAGHVDSRVYGLGVLAGLKQARVGQVITVRSGARSLSYRIISKRKIPKAELASGTDAFRQDVGQRLVVITCGGPFNLTTHRYEDNLVVVAVPLA